MSPQNSSDSDAPPPPSSSQASSSSIPAMVYPAPAKRHSQSALALTSAAASTSASISPSPAPPSAAAAAITAFKRNQDADADLDLNALASEFGIAVPLLAELVATSKQICRDPKLYNKRHIKMLPDEILLPIFRHAYASLASHPLGIPSERSNLLVKRVSHVCSRFRRLAISCPELWAAIHSSQRVDEVAVFTQRSKDCPLTIMIYGKDHRRFGSDMSEDDLRQFIDVLSPHQHRWRELRISSTPSRTIGQLMRQVQQHVQYLPMLECIHVHRYKWDSDYDEHCNIRLWHAPNLRLFHGSGVVPTHFRGQNISHFSLTCQVNTIPEIFACASANGSDDDALVDMDRNEGGGGGDEGAGDGAGAGKVVGGIATSTPLALKHLFLRVLSVSDHEPIALGVANDSNSNSTTPTSIHLPKLETLEIITSSPGTYTSFWVLCIPHLSFANLQSLSVHVPLENVIDLFCGSGSGSGSGGRLNTIQFGSLRDLRFRCEDLGVVCQVLGSLGKFPLLERVVIDDCCYSSLKTSPPLPPSKSNSNTNTIFSLSHSPSSSTQSNSPSPLICYDTSSSSLSTLPSLQSLHPPTPASTALSSLTTLPPHLTQLTFAYCRFNQMHGIEVLAARLRLALDFGQFGEAARVSGFAQSGEVRNTNGNGNVGAGMGAGAGAGAGAGGERFGGFERVRFETYGFEDVSWGRAEEVRMVLEGRVEICPV